MILIQSKQRAFTLIELMITVAIIGILAAVAYPSFQDQIFKGKRAEGKARLLYASQQLERYYSDNNTYVVATGFPTLFGLAAAAAVYSGSNNEPSSAYTLTVAATTNGYTLTAARAGSQVNDTKCGDFTLTNTGVKGISGGTGTVANCW
jgi:type IV pilus assembly protein PilE